MTKPSIDSNNNKAPNTPAPQRAPNNPNAKPAEKKLMWGIAEPWVVYTAGGGLIALLVIVIGGAMFISSKNKAEAQRQQAIAQAEAEAQAKAQAEEENKPQAVEGVYQITPELLAHYEAKNTENGQYWAIVRPVVNEVTGATEKSDPLRLLANQAIDKVIMQSGHYNSVNGGGISTADGQGTVGFDDPVFKQAYMQAVDGLISHINQNYEVKIETVVFNEGTNKAEVAIVAQRSPEGSIEITSPEMLLTFENNVMNGANMFVPQMISQIQAQAKTQAVEKEQNPDVQEREQRLAEEKRAFEEEMKLKEAQAKVEVEKSQMVIQQLEANLQDTRRALIQSEQAHNQTIKAMQQQDVRMGQFIQQLEDQPSVNNKLNLTTIDEKKHGLKVTAVVNDRVYLQDKGGEQYTARIGDLIVLEDGRKLTLIDSEKKQVVVEK